MGWWNLGLDTFKHKAQHFFIVLELMNVARMKNQMFVKKNCFHHATYKVIDSDFEFQYWVD